MTSLPRSLSLALGLVAVVSLSACVTDPYYARPAPYPTAYPAPVARPAPYPAYQQSSYLEYGRISNIEVMQSEQARAPSGAGAIIGGLLGAVVGNQIGHGGGRALATGIGVMGGAVAGNQIEGNQRGPIVQTYRISVQTDNGSMRAFDVPSPGDLRIGDRVRIQDGQIQRF
ncbi:outer membrane lipoprotein [Xylophilus sp. ASV27]|uniref:glycine zipper 2TM domain-containing protein n=1 Tax=Xylophilus sp. ASV27 TaxID=2795129 RepID=UPI0018EDBC60|nr:glycine zipper 2TM domain-containing protein [Xylophilus sp. ASV27]